MSLYTLLGIFAAIGIVLTLLRSLLNKPSSYVNAFAKNFVGVLFVFSGFIKANDPTGFGYKLEEYYDVFAQDTSRVHFLSSFFLWMKGSAEIQSVIICIIEMVLGFMLLTGMRKKLVLWLISAMIVFFTFLTFYSAYYNKVTDCGCFGDFMHLTPWQSFSKDFLLLVVLAGIIIGHKHIAPAFSMKVERIMLGVFTVLCISFPFYTWTHLPVFDFRPYKIGTNILEAMKAPPGSEGKFETKLYYKNLKSGEVKEFTTQNYPWKDSLTWKYDTTITTTLVEPVLAPIHDFHINTVDGSEYTEDILNQPGPKFFLVCHDLSLTKRSVFDKVNDLAALCKKDSVMFIGLTSSSGDSINTLKKQVHADFDFYTCDDTQLKTMIRSNPGLVLLDGAVVKAMWPARSLPTYSEVKEKYFKK